MKALALTAALGIDTIAPAAQAAPAGGSGTVPGVYDALLSTMKNGGSGRFAKLAPVNRSSFDLASMARLPVTRARSAVRSRDGRYQELPEDTGRYQELPEFTGIGAEFN